MVRIHSALDDIFILAVEDWDDGDAYIEDDLGHTHWGTHGAAGSLIRHRGDDGRDRYLLQKRSPWVDHGNTWGIPGGALHKNETPEMGAVRETKEELGHVPPLTHSHTHTDDHGGWAYHTVVFDTPHRFTPQPSPDEEATDHQWFTRDEMNRIPLHPGFAASVDKVIAAPKATVTR